MLRALDAIIDRIAMYRLVIYYLAGLLAVATVLSMFGGLHYNPVYILISTGILILACWMINEAFAYIFDAPANPESSIITALILALIITPNPSGFGFTFLLAASGLAIASKYLLTIGNKHIFNPAAIAVALTAFGPAQSASWWVGTGMMLPFVLVGGLIVTRKIRRTRMVVSFFVSTLLATIVYALLAKSNVFISLKDMVLSSSVFFLGFIMLTEPMTSPSSAGKQTWYAALVGILLPPQVHLFRFYSSPEIALMIGNIFSYVVSHKTKLFPVLKEKIKISNNSADFVFTPDKKLIYQPGQYMEWTLPHTGADSRGSRRYFTLASSPTEPDIRIGVKFYDKGSSFKAALLDMDEQSQIAASQLTGDFVLPKDRSQKLVFIAGGIGITPFRGMVKYLLDTRDMRDVTLLYSASTQDDIAYKDIFEEARRTIGLRTIYALTGRRAVKSDSNTLLSPITKELIMSAVPDFLDRKFYISGTHPMVEAMQDILEDLGVHHHQIKIDFFPGYA